MLTILHSELSLSLLSLFVHRGLQQIQFSSNEIQLMGQHCRMLKINTTTPPTTAKNNCNEKKIEFLQIRLQNQYYNTLYNSKKQL